MFSLQHLPIYFFTFFCSLFVTSLAAQTVTNGSLNGSPIGNNQVLNAAGWTKCGGSPDLCNITFPSYLTTSQVTPDNSPDGGNWLGLASISIGECAQTTITGLTIGNSYTLYFCGASFGTGAGLFNQSPVLPTIRVGTTQQTYSIPMTASTWVPLQLPFVATATTMTLQCEHAGSVPANAYYASFDGFNLSAPCATVLLPVELLSFNAFPKKDKYATNVYWQTAREQDSESFVLQRSVDGIHFKNIATIPAATYSDDIKNYTFLDQELPISNNQKGGLFYYRLQQLDLYNNVLYSEIRAVNFPVKTLLGFNIYPNPTKSNLNLDFLSPNSENSYTLSIFNALGQIVLSKNIEAHKGLNQLQIDVQELNQGTYVIQLANTTKSYRRSFIKQ